MSKLQKGILWAAAGITYVFAMNIVLAWATTGYLDWDIIARMAVMLLPVLGVTAILFPYAGTAVAAKAEPVQPRTRAKGSLAEMPGDMLPHKPAGA